MVPDLDVPPQRENAGPARPPPRRRVRYALISASVVVLAFAAAAAVQAVGVGNDLRSGKAVLSAAFSDLSNLRLVERTGAAERRFRSARARAGGTWLRIWSHVPLLGRPARYVRSVAEAGTALAGRASEAARRIEPMLQRSDGDPSSRLALLDAVERELRVLGGAFGDIEIGSPGLPLPPFASLAREVDAGLARARSAIADGIVGVGGLRSFLAGPTRYLVLAGNNAEMRAGGMVLQVGTLFAGDGRIVAGGFASTASLILPRSVPVPAELSALYGWLELGREWRNTGTSPNFPAVAPLYTAMIEAAGRPPVQGVLQLDVVALRYLLEVVGPVVIDGQRFDAGNVERTVLHDLYAEYGRRQADRRADLSRLAAATFVALDERSWRPGDLASALRRATAGRHLLVWSRLPEQQAAWRRLGAAGALERDGFMLTVQNHGGDKLDWFVRPSVALASSKAPRGARRWTATIRIANPTPDGEPSYVAGDGSKRPAGAYRGFVAVYLPGWASDVEVSGAGVRVVGEDGRMRLVGMIVDVPRRETVSLTVRFTMPPGRHRLVLLPSARAVPVPFTVDGERTDDRRRRTLAV